MKYSLIFLLLLSSCYRVGNQIEPKLNCVVQDRYLQSLPSPFPLATADQKLEDWEKEEKIGRGFAHELDLYQTITAFKRASFLLPPSFSEKKEQLDYSIFISYYLGGKYQETIYSFENSSLRKSNHSFLPYHDVLLIMYDSYLHLYETDKADSLLNYMSKIYPDTAQKLELSKLLSQGNVDELSLYASAYPEVNHLLTEYRKGKKSVSCAQLLNAILPGSGFLYLGQKQSALTSFLVNGVFIWSSVYFFNRNNIPAGAIFASLEAGWYFGGIYGAGLEAKFYNERLYERLATSMMNKERYFPILMLQYGF